MLSNNWLALLPQNLLVSKLVFGIDRVILRDLIDVVVEF